MNHKLKIMALLSLGLLIVFAFWQNRSQQEMTEKELETLPAPPKNSQEKKVESHARESELSTDAQADFEPDFGDDMREVSPEENQSDPSFQDFDALEALFEEVEQEWQGSMEKLIRQDLGLSEQVLERYYELRDDYDESKLMAFEDYHQKMIDEHGADYAIQPSVQMEDFDNNVLPQYIEQLQELIGQEGVRQYIQMKDEFNQRIREKGHPGAALILIDF